jgi:CDP-diacylglycerol--serine O-phosphatidyltransferase
VCGFFAIVVASRITSADMLESVRSPQFESVRELFRSTDPTHNLVLAGGLIFLAMVFDMFDGQVARITRVTSDFGAQLDSLCDAVSFGVAPAILLVKMCPQFTSVHKEAIWSIAALFAGCAVLRLARYNVELDDEVDDHMSFIGLPSPAAAAVIASFAVLSYTLRSEINLGKYEVFDFWLQRLLPPFALLLALLMVSRIPYPHIVTQFLRGQRSFAHLIAVVFSIMALLIVRAYALPLICIIFVLGPPCRYLWNLARHRETEQEPLF